MLALIQRVTHANVQVNNEIIGQIQTGILAFIGVQKEDTEKNADRMIERLLGYRIFGDHNDRMNLSLKEIQGGLLLVPQFTLAADTQSGMRPSFSSAAAPETGEKIFLYLIQQAKTHHHPIETGQFGANMQITLCNNGPVTFLLHT